MNNRKVVATKKGVFPDFGKTPFKADSVGLDHGDVHRRKPLWALLNVECDMVTLIEGLEPDSIDPGVMNKDIRTVFLFDETETLAAVKPLYNSVGHCDFLLSKKFS